MSGITTLPPEILLDIFSYLSPLELIDTVQHVCSRWRQLARHPSMWENFVYGGKHGNTAAEIENFTKKCPMVKHIRTFHNRYAPKEMFDKMVKAVIKNCSDLRTFSVDNGHNHLSLFQINALFEMFPNLESFLFTVNCKNAVKVVELIGKCTKLKTLTVIVQEYCEGIFMPIVVGCLSLESLKIDCRFSRRGIAYVPEEEVLNFLPHLKDRLLYLGFSGLRPPTQKIVDILGTFTKLEGFMLHLRRPQRIETVNYDPLTRLSTLKNLTLKGEIGNVNALNSLFVAMFRKPFPLLQNLHIEIIYGNNCDNSVLKDVCLGYPNLKSLTLVYEKRDGVTETFEEIGKLKNLESLVYRGNKKFTDDDVLHISQCSKLKHLELFNSYRLTDLAIDHLSNCRSIETLNLGYCSLSEKSLLLIPKHFERLKILYVKGNDIKYEYLEALEEKMPSLKIHYD